MKILQLPIIFFAATAIYVLPASAAEAPPPANPIGKPPVLEQGPPPESPTGTLPIAEAPPPNIPATSVSQPLGDRPAPPSP